jgi:hypothetical protein
MHVSLLPRQRAPLQQQQQLQVFCLMALQQLLLQL